MSAALPLRWQAFRLWKQGNAAEQYEDAGAGDAARGRFAVADGASEASFAASWAQLLIDGFLSFSGKPWRGLDWIEPLRQKWAAEVDEMPLPWYAEEKRELGAFATFLGVVFRRPTPERPGRWRALAVGDCCLFHIRDGRLRLSFPVTRSEDFDNRPELLRSRPPEADEPEVRRAAARGRWRPGDRFLLMSDALAQWFLLRLEQGDDPLAEVGSLLAEKAPDDAFAGWVRERRERGLLRNDDVTLMVVDVESEERRDGPI